MKDKHAVGRKWPEMVVKWAIFIVIRFDSEYRLTCFTKKRLTCRLFSKKMIMYGMNPVNVPRAKIAFPVSSESNM